MREIASTEPLLVGRRTETEALRTQLHALADGRGGAVLVTGEAGAGKSALLRSVFTTGARDHRVVWTSGDELSQVFPLLPFVEAVDDERKAGISAMLRGGAAMSDPALAASEELVAWLDDLCAYSPVVLVFDDLHWADAASLRLWNRLTRSAEQLPLLVVGSMRPDRTRADLMALRRRVNEMLDQGVLLDLPPLSAGEEAQLVRSLVGGTPGRRLIGLVGAAAGNPLYVTELTGALMRDGVLAHDDNGVIEAKHDYRPASLSSAITARLDVVPHDVRDLLRLAALLGVEFDVSDLAVASARPVSDLIGMLGRAQSAGVLTTTASGMAFRHPLIRDVLCEQVAGSVRAAWHQEVAQALAQAGQSASAVARQLMAAIEVGGDLPATDWLINWLVVHEEELASQSTAVVKALFAHTLNKLPLTDPLRAAVALPLASALLRANDVAEAERLAVQTLDNVTTRFVDAETVLALGFIVIECRLAIANPRDAMAMLDQLESKMDWDDREQLRLRVMRARLYASYGRGDESRALIEEALPAARRIGDPWSTGTVHHTQFINDLHRASPQVVLAHAERGIAAIEDDPASLDLHMSLLADRSLALLELCAWDEAKANTSRLRRVAERTGSERRLMQCSVVEVLRLFGIGDWDDMLSEVEAAGPMQPALLPCFERAVVVCLHRDDPARAAHYLSGVEEILRRSSWGMRIGGQYAVHLRALVMEHSGDLQGALETQLDAVANLWTGAETPTSRVVDLAMRLGREADAARVCAFAESRALVRVRDGLVPHCRGLVRRDPELLIEAAEHYRRKRLRQAEAEALEAAGLALAHRGDTREARRAMTDSLEIYSSLGATWDTRRVRAAFREHGVRVGSREPRRRPVAGWQSLTATEVKVANLVAEGLSNRMIAEHLFLSRRTVDTHMSHILAKLGVRSRVEVARMAIGHPAQ